MSQELIFNGDSPTSFYVFVPVLNDECLEDTESFKVNITTLMDCVEIVGDSYAVVEIFDDDGK